MLSLNQLVICLKVLVRTHGVSEHLDSVNIAPPPPPKKSVSASVYALLNCTAIFMYRSSRSSLLEILETGLSISKPDHIYDIVVKVFKHSIDVWTAEMGKFLALCMLYHLVPSMAVLKLPKELESPAWDHTYLCVFLKSSDVVLLDSIVHKNFACP